MQTILALAVLCFSTAGLAQPVAWSARVKDDIDEAPTQTNLIFSETTANSGLWYNPDTGVFTVPEDKYGTYFMAMSIGIPSGKTAEVGVYTTVGIRQYVGLRFQNDDTDGVEYSSRSYMRSIGADVSVQMRTSDALAGTSLLGRPYYTTSWNMFRYADISDYTIAFSVSRNTDHFGFIDVLPWQRQFVNDGQDGVDPFNMTTSKFTAPVNGLYFFTMSSGSTPEQPMQAVLSVFPRSGEALIPIASLNRTSRNSIGLDTTARSLILPLYENDQVGVGNGIGSSLGSNYNTLQTSFSGFGYALEAPEDEEVVVFCAFMENWSWTGTIPTTIENWSGVTVNFVMEPYPEPFDTETGIFYVPFDGTYFFSFSVGVAPQSNVFVALTDKDGYEAARIDRRNKKINGIDTLSRDVIVDLTDDQNMRLQLGSTFSLHSSQYGRETSFMGMRLRDIVI